MKQIQLTQGQITIVDDEDYEWLSQYSWHARYEKNTRSFYAQTAIKDPESSTGWRTLSMQRMLMGLKYSDGKIVHHKNHDTLDNTRGNLEICSTLQNNRHAVKRRVRTSSRYKGACWHKRIEKWQSYITVDTKRIYLGYFTDEKEAAKAYNDAAIEYFGEYALLNEID